MGSSSTRFGVNMSKLFETTTRKRGNFELPILEVGKLSTKVCFFTIFGCKATGFSGFGGTPPEN